ncbi:MAG: hypothetical protein RLZZ337_1261 [Bacteroidota bacterium]|jgi:linoleoyl-CoA desaturase
MQKTIVRFSNQNRPEFIADLRKNVNQYFIENNISKHANGNMVFKTVFMLTLYLVPLLIMLSGVITSVPILYLMWFLMALGMSGIGLSIMHDANHGAYSTNKRINKWLGSTINFVGGYDINWIIQHNVLHHSFTNIHGHDEDISKPILRLSPDQEYKPKYRFQAYYATFIYGLMTIFWLLAKDIIQLADYSKRGLMKGQKKSFSRALTEIILTKTFYIVTTVVLPIILIDLPWYHIVLGFLMMQFISGLILALIFQPAHVSEDTTFFTPDKNGSVENNWAIHQLLTTTNFANKNKLFTWLIGGLNHQIEHHLFPTICHVHYPAISKIVKETAESHNIPYYHFDTYFEAVKSHYTFLNELGKPPKEMKMAS